MSEQWLHVWYLFKFLSLYNQFVSLYNCHQYLLSARGLGSYLDLRLCGGIPKLFLVFTIGAISLLINTNLWRDLDGSIQMSSPLRIMKKCKKAQFHSLVCLVVFGGFFLQKNLFKLLVVVLTGGHEHSGNLQFLWNGEIFSLQLKICRWTSAEIRRCCWTWLS